MSLRTEGPSDPGPRDAWDAARSGFDDPQLDQDEAHLPVGVSLSFSLFLPPAQVSLLCVSLLRISLCGFSSCVYIYLCLCPPTWVQTIGLAVTGPRACISTPSHTWARPLTSGACVCISEISILIFNRIGLFGN